MAQFQPISAALTVPDRLTVLSNMPIQQESKPEPGFTTVRFEKTPSMSTYLLAFVVAELERLEARDRFGRNRKG